MMIFNSIFKTAMRRGLGFKFKPAAFHQPKTLTIVILSRTSFERRPVIGKCRFHTTPPKNALPPVFVFLLRYVLRLGAMLSGRAIRKWWMRLSPREREKVLDQIRSKKSKIACAGTVAAGVALLYYLEHLVEDPITKRKRFIMLSQKQMNQIGEFEFERQTMLFRSAIVPHYHPIYRRVLRVVNNLLLSNKDLTGVKNKVWSVTVVDKPDITNAFALPHGKIFVFTGMLNVCTNDDQLAVVLAHEISHSILGHVAETMSRLFLIDFFLLVPTILLWFIFPDAWAVFSYWITSELTKIFLHLPFSRALEKEADVLGLHLAARSCYDVREAPIFWSKMKYVSKDFPFEWLSTHPSHETRQLELSDLVPRALQVRDLSQCPPLRQKPRVFLIQPPY